MNNLKSLKSLLQRAATVVLSAILMIGMVLSYSNSAQAAIDTTSAATKADAERINQRKEEAPHYPNWYNDQRSLESYMDGEGVRERGNSPTDQNNDVGNNPIRQDRVNGYRAENDPNLIERSRGRLSNVADTVRDKLNPNSASNSKNYRGSYDSTTSTEDLGDRVGNRLERAKETFQEATERAAEGSNPIITGESNR